MFSVSAFSRGERGMKMSKRNACVCLEGGEERFVLFVCLLWDRLNEGRRTMLRQRKKDRGE